MTMNSGLNTLESLQSKPEYKFGAKKVEVAEEYYMIKMYRKRLFSDEWFWELMTGCYVSLLAARNKEHEYSLRFPANELKVVNSKGETV